MQFSQRLALSSLLVTALSTSIYSNTYSLNYTTTVPLAAFAASIFYLYSKKPDAKFAPRYNISLLAKPNIGLRKYAKNVWYIIDDGIIGQTGKSRTAKLTEDGTLECSNQEVDPAGILGTTEPYLKGVKKTLSSMASVIGICYLFNNSNNIWNKIHTDATKEGYIHVPAPKVA